MEALASLTVAVVVACGVYLVLRARTFPVVMGLALLSCLPVLLAARPQMTDYPSHLARYYIMLDGGQRFLSLARDVQFIDQASLRPSAGPPVAKESDPT